MSHSGWPDSVRVGSGCAIIMMGKWAFFRLLLLQDLWPAILWLVVLLVFGLTFWR
jgi:hypothetical protein